MGCMVARPVGRRANGPRKSAATEAKRGETPVMKHVIEKISAFIRGASKTNFSVSRRGRFRAATGIARPEMSASNQLSLESFLSDIHR
jgi:hypothetical protein